MSELVKRARSLAEFLHKDHVRRYTGLPYFTHLEEVAKLIEGAGLPDVAVAAGYLHDSIEDVGATKASLFAALTTHTDSPAFVAKVKLTIELVVWLTDMDELPGMEHLKKLNRAKRKALTVIKMSGAPVLAKSAKLADTISNTGSIAEHDANFARAYLPEIEKLLEVLADANPMLVKMASDSVAAAKAKLA